MTGKIRKLGIAVALTVIFAVVIVVLAVSSSEVGVTCTVGTEGLPPPVCDLSTVPQSVVDDAVALATELFGDGEEECSHYISQLLAMYLEAKDKDFVVVFNPGGWGWNLVEASPDWCSIFTGIKSELDSSGYTSLLLNYQRTTDSLRGYIDELVEMMALYPAKTKDLASRVEFLTSHIPDLRVIVTGESNGTIICDSVMNELKDNHRVYSIQTGPPFWHRNTMLDRTLLLTNNGIIPDSFSQGDFPTMIGANLKALFGLSQPEDGSGKILRFVRAPGHEYKWQYPGVYSEIINFLDRNFGIKW